MDIACTGRYIVTCSKLNDLVIWDLKGQILANVDTYHGTTHRARISPCGRFVAASGNILDFKKLTTSVKVYFHLHKKN